MPSVPSKRKSATISRAANWLLMMGAPPCPLSRSADDYKSIAAQTLSAQNTDIASFPLATVEPDKPLPLISGVNPAWQKQIDALRTQAIVPLFGEKQVLLASEWDGLCAKFAAFEAWQSTKPASSIEQLGKARLSEISGSNHQDAINNLITQDKAVENEVKAIRSVEQLLRYSRDLFKLINNFVSFRSFYTGRDKAIFQLGTLYLDGRSCELCVRVEDIGKHAEFANMSGLYLAYCDCVRKGGAEKMSIAAAFTDGDSDFLMVGRNGIFYDRKGQDWDATIVRILDHPISIRQAFWSPYKKLIKFISEQLEKMAASKAAAADEKLIAAAVVQPHAGRGGHASSATAKTTFRCRQIRRDFCGDRAGARRYRRNSCFTGQRNIGIAILADTFGDNRPDVIDFRPGHDCGLVQVEETQPRPRAGCQWLGNQRAGAHQYSIWQVFDQNGLFAGRFAPLAVRSVCGEKTGMAILCFDCGSHRCFARCRGKWAFWDAPVWVTGA